MRREIARERERMAKRYVASKRHTIQVDFDPYLRSIERERHGSPLKRLLRPPARAGPSSGSARRDRGDLTATVASRLPAAWGLRGEPLPAIRRGLLVAAAGRRSRCWSSSSATTPLAGALGTATLICGFIAFDAPARVRVRWQLLCAPLVGVAAALGVLSSATACDGGGGDGAGRGRSRATWSRSRCGWRSRASPCVLALLIAQGLFLDPGDAWRALVFGAGGGAAAGGDGGGRRGCSGTASREPFALARRGAGGVRPRSAART